MPRVKFVPRKPGETPPPECPVVTWGLEFVIASALLDDEPLLKMTLAHYTERTCENAAAAGCGVFGDPEITHEDAVWVDNWSEQGGAMVGADVALMAGHFGKPVGRRYLITWKTTRGQTLRRMKRSDIDDQHVIDLAQQWQDDKAFAAGVVEALMAEGIPEKLALAKVEHLDARGYLESGTSPYFSWPTGKRLP